jgi:hypothetical protein
MNANALIGADDIVCRRIWGWRSTRIALFMGVVSTPGVVVDRKVVNAGGVSAWTKVGNWS